MFPASSAPQEGVYKSVSQIDLVPSLSLLLGIPIPYGNLGAAITDLLGDDPLHKMHSMIVNMYVSLLYLLLFSMHMLLWSMGLGVVLFCKVHRSSGFLHPLTQRPCLNYSHPLPPRRQVYRYLQHYSKQTGSFDEAAMKRLESMFNDAMTTHTQVVQETSIVSPNEADQIVRKCEVFLREAASMCREKWTQFDEPVMIRGFSTLLLGIIVCIALIIAVERRLQAGKKERDEATFSLDEPLGEVDARRGSTDGSIPHLLRHRSSSSSSSSSARLEPSSRNDRVDVFVIVVCVAVLVFYLQGLFSNSFIVEERAVVHFLSILIICVSCVRFMLFTHDSVRAIQLFFACAIPLRVLYAFQDVQPLNEPLESWSWTDLGLIGGFVLDLPLSLFVHALTIMTWVAAPTVAIMVHWRLLGTTGLGGIVSSIVFAGQCMTVALFWLREWVPFPLPLSSGPVVVYLTSLLWVVVEFIANLSAHSNTIVGSSSSNISSVPPPPSPVLSSSEAYPSPSFIPSKTPSSGVGGASPFTFHSHTNNTLLQKRVLLCFFILYPPLCLLQGPRFPAIVSSLCAFLFSFFRMSLMGIAPTPSRTKGSFLIVSCLPTATVFFFIAIQLFFSTGHQNDFGSLHIAAPYVGFDEFGYYRSGALLFLNTFSGYFLAFLSIIGYFAVLGAHTTGYTKGHASTLSLNATDLVATALLSFALLFSLRMTVTCVNVFIQRRHLMVWAIFAPKFIFDTASCVVVHLCCTLWCIFLAPHSPDSDTEPVFLERRVRI